MRFLAIPLNNLARRKLRTALTALGVAVAVGSLVMLVGLSRGVDSAWVNGLKAKGIHIVATQKGTVQLLAATVDETLGQKMLRTEGVSDVSGELIALLSLDSGEAILVTGWPKGSFLWRTLRLDEGAAPKAGDMNAVVIGQALAGSLAKGAGDSIRIQGREFTVTGITSHGGAMNSRTLVMPVGPLQELLGKNGRVTAFDLRVEDASDQARLAVVLDRLRSGFPRMLFHKTEDVADDNQVLRMLRGFTWGTSLIAMVVSLIIILNTLMMSVAERTREMGILAAVGWRKRRILAVIMLEGGLLCLAGGAVGLALGIGGLYWLAEASPLQGFIEPSIGFGVVLEALVSALAIGAVGSLLPALRATGLSPVEALRHE